MARIYQQNIKTAEINLANEIYIHYENKDQRFQHQYIMSNHCQSSLENLIIQ